MSTKEESLDLFKFAVEECGDYMVYLEIKNNEVQKLATSNGLCTLHEVGYCKPPWVKW